MYFPGKYAMPSVVTIAPNGEGTLHSHREKQWGVLPEDCAIRIQGGEGIAVTDGQFSRTPGGMLPTMRAGPERCQVLNIF